MSPHTLAMTPLVLLSLLSSALCLATPLESVHASRVSEPSMRSNATSCPTCLLAKSSTTTQNVFPWLFNNNNARFMYSRTDDRGWPVYQYFYNGKPMWLHFYDEGLFYDGFYIINDLEVSVYISRVSCFDDIFSQDGYEEADGRVYIYNSDSDECVEVRTSKLEPS